MNYHFKRAVTFFIIVILSISGVFYFYFNSSYYLNRVPNVTWEKASIKVTTNWGVCSPSFPCYDVYRLNSELAYRGEIFHNDKLKRNLSEGEAKKLIRTSYMVYQKKVCTPNYENEVSEKYELVIDGKPYKFGEDKGCKEMQEVLDTLRK